MGVKEDTSMRRVKSRTLDVYLEHREKSHGAPTLLMRRSIFLVDTTANLYKTFLTFSGRPRYFFASIIMKLRGKSK